MVENITSDLKTILILFVNLRSAKSKSKPYTKVTWLPDYERFGIESLSDDMFNLFKKRTFDIGVVTDKSVRVKFNGKAVPNKSFEQYIDTTLGQK